MTALYHIPLLFFSQVILNCGALGCLLNLLMTNHKKSIKKEACWTISNITAGTKASGGGAGCAHLPNIPLILSAIA